MYYRNQLILFIKTKKYEKVQIKIKFHQQKGMLILICENIKLTIIDLLVKKEESKKYEIINIDLLKKLNIKTFIHYILYQKYKINKKQIYIKFLINLIEELKDEIKIHENRKYIHKKNKRYLEYKDEKIRFNFLYVYIYDYFVSINYIKDYNNKIYNYLILIKIIIENINKIINKSLNIKNIIKYNLYLIKNYKTNLNEYLKSNK